MTTAQTAASSTAQLALTEQLARQLVNYHIGPQPDEVYQEKQQNMVLAKNGVFRVISTPVALFSLKLQEQVTEPVSSVANAARRPIADAVPGVGEMWEGCKLLVPRMQLRHYLEVLTWYRDVHTKDRTEASVLFFWNTNNIEIPTHYLPNKQGVREEIKGLRVEGQLITYVPRQKNSSGLSNFTGDGMVDWLRENCSPLMETHSHHTMGAFWSGTDNDNENIPQFYMVYGLINDAKPAFKLRFCIGKHKIDIDKLDVMFEMPETEVIEHTNIGGQVIEARSKKPFAGPWPKVAYPEDWMGQHSATYAVAGTSNPNYNYGRGYYGHDYDDQGIYGGHAGNTGASAETGGKKNAEANNSSGDAANKTSGATQKTVVETATSRVEIVADASVGSFTLGQVTSLIEAICEAGYDRDIAEAIYNAQAQYSGA